MATKARNRQKKTKTRPHGRYLLILLALTSLAGVGYFVFLQAPLFTQPAGTTPTANVADAPQPPAEEPLATPPPAEPLPPETSTPAPTAATVANIPPTAPPPMTAPVPTPPPEPAVAPAKLSKQAVSPPVTKTAARKATAAGKKPMVAIIIDDMGYQPAVGQKMLALPLNLSFSFLPAGPQTRELATAAQGKKRDILLHLPLEATDAKVDPGPGTITVAMGAEEVRKHFADNLAQVPMAIGLNNHMGSRFTEERPAMATLLKEVKQRGLFFLDSRTSAKSIACAVAKEEGVPCLPRHLFLDNDQTQAAIAKQIDALLALATKQGWAIGISHPHPATLAALTASQQKITEQAEVVGIGAIFRAHGR